MPTLAATQRLLRHLITAPEGVAATLAADTDRGGDLRGGLAATIRGDGALDAAQRLDIYANMYFFRLLDVLKEDYPACVETAGDAGFHNLVTDYLLAHPPAHFSIRYAGQALPEFAAVHALSAAHPALGDLARFERALGDAFDAPDEVALGAGDLGALPADRWAGLRMTLHPSVRLLQSAWAVHEVRARVDAGEAGGRPASHPTALVVWRSGWQVRHRSLATGELDALAALRDGAPFADICAGAATDRSAAAAAVQISAWLAGWVASGWIGSVCSDR
ncbi:MAG: DNA-binding domain-containing protein [Candidatus Binatia bacterium]